LLKLTMPCDSSEVVCQDQSETGPDETIFILEDGASISNVIIGPNQAEGIHCLGSCTITNVWFQKVCEDAITASGPGNVLISGGGAFAADDKIIQINGIDVTVTVENWYAEDFGKVARSCGNCSGNGGPRHIIMKNVLAVDGGVLCGINTNYGDTCVISGSCHSDGKDCDLYEGNDTGDEPDKISSGPDGEFCIVESMSEDC
jgi:pectate lyase